MSTQREQLQQYFTPTWVAEALVEGLMPQIGDDAVVVEPSCGDGRFLAVLPHTMTAVGVEIDPVQAAKARANTGRQVITGDFTKVSLPVEPTAIIGNPPFSLKIVDAFLARAHQLLPTEGLAAFILPAYAFQTAERVAGYADHWAIEQTMLPRNVYPGLSKPLMFATFRKGVKRVLVGLSLYREAADIQKLPREYRDILENEVGSIWLRAVLRAVSKLGGRAALGDIYQEIEGTRPTRTKWWREKVRQVCQAHLQRFDRGVYGLPDAQACAA